jgi:hypothetical protein
MSVPTGRRRYGADVGEHLVEAVAIAESVNPTLVRVRSIHHAQEQA